MSIDLRELLAAVFDVPYRHPGMEPPEPPPPLDTLPPPEEPLPPPPPPKAPERYDPFVIRADNPLSAEHCAIREYLYQAPDSPPYTVYQSEYCRLPAWRAILEANPAQRKSTLWALIERLETRRGHSPEKLRSRQDILYARSLGVLLLALLPGGLEFSLPELVRLLDFELHPVNGHTSILHALLPLVQRTMQTTRGKRDAEIPPDVRSRLVALRPVAYQMYNRHLPAMLEEMLASRFRAYALPLDGWSAIFLQALESLPDEQQGQWIALLEHAQRALQSKPSRRWLEQAAGLLQPIGHEAFTAHMLAWLAALESHRGDAIQEPARSTLKGLVWACSLVEDEALAAALAQASRTCLLQLSRWRMRAQKVGTACMVALGLMPGLHGPRQLLALYAREQFTCRHKQVFTALQNAARHRRMSISDLEETSLPAFGLDAQGRRVETLAGYRAHLEIISPKETRLAWFNPAGKALKGIPARVRREAPQALAGLQQARKDLQTALERQHTRIESLLAIQHSWSFGEWQSRYQQHPLLAALGRNLIWHFEEDKRCAAGIILDGQLVDVQARPLDWLTPKTRVRLWHPALAAVDEVLAWRVFLEARHIQQPFPQAQREIYLLTDAERRTETYSNRFASYILQTDGLFSLCRRLGWDHGALGRYHFAGGLRHRQPDLGLHAEFWLDVIHDPEFNPHGGAVCSDQVRFYASTDRHGQSPLPLADIPAAYFSEIMRMVDQIVAECSNGVNPHWQDRTRRPPGQALWAQMSFGELTEAAQERKTALQELLPRLKIATCCEIRDKFLFIKGSRRTYKIHLGSGNVLMEPGDQYLCIVPGHRSTPQRGLFLPFQGDPTLALILSKAFLLADDAHIQDQTITRQIEYAARR